MSSEMQNPFKKSLMTEAELAAYLGLSAWTIRRFRLNEGMPVIAIAGRFFYRLESVQNWLASRETSGPATAGGEEPGVIRAIRA